MASDEIFSVAPVSVSSVASSRPRASTLAAAVANPPASPASNGSAAPSVSDLPPSQQIATLINETLSGLNFVPPSPANELLVNELAANLSTNIDTQSLTPAQQAALLVNETLQGLNFVPPSSSEALLLNELNPATTLFLESQNLTPVQQTTAAVNETLATLAATTEVPGVVVGQAPATEAAAATVPAAGTPSPATAVTAGLAATATGVSVTTPGPALPVEVSPAPSPISTTGQPERPPLVVDRNPIAVGVYEIRDPKAAPAEPRPRRRDVVPAPPVGRVRPVDRLILRREWERRRGRGRGVEIPSQPPSVERSIQQMIARTNEDLAASGLPLRLVLAKGEAGYSIDVYDCTDDSACHLAQEVHVDLNKLLTTLDNLQHETGIMVNIVM